VDDWVGTGHVLNSKFIIFILPFTAVWNWNALYGLAVCSGCLYTPHPAAIYSLILSTIFVYIWWHVDQTSKLVFDVLRVPQLGIHILQKQVHRSVSKITNAAISFVMPHIPSVCLSVCLSICVCFCMYVCILCTYVCITYVCMYVCMYVCVRMYVLCMYVCKCM